MPKAAPWFIEKFQDTSAIGYRLKQRLHYSQSPFQTIEIYETSDYGNMLVLDGCIMLTEAHEFIYHEMLVHVPMISHPKPQAVLVVGGGDGGTVREVLRHSSVQRVDMVEIDEQVVEVSRKYLPGLAGRLDDPKVHLVFQDAVQFIQGRENVYDVALVDSTDPIGPGEGLFSRAFYQDVLRALKPGGMVVAQSESPFSLQREPSLILEKLDSIFPLTRLYWCPMPPYPYGTWTFSYGSKGGDLPEPRRQAAGVALEEDTKYYNLDIHQAAFVLPNFMRKF